MLCVVAAMLLLITSTICGNDSIQQAYQLAGWGWSRLWGTAPPPQPATERAACAFWQPLLVLLAYSIIGQYLYVCELAQRRALLARALASTDSDCLRTPGRPASSRRDSQSGSWQRGRAVPIPKGTAPREAAVLQLLLKQSAFNSAADYWCSFALPGVCCLRTVATVAAACQL